MADHLSSINKGTIFENEVIDLLKLHGKEIIGESLRGHKKVDITFTEKHFSKTYRYAVECKNYESKLQKKVLLTIVNDYSALQDAKLIDKLLIVTRHGLGPASLEYLNLKDNIEHTTYGELLNSTIDFTQYIKNIISEYENSTDGLNSYYIDINVKSNEVNELKTTDLSTIINEWICSPDNQPIAILGSYGQGKTSFSKKLSHDLAFNYLKDDSLRIPIYIKLSSISKEQSIEGLLGTAFTSTGLVRNYNYYSFYELNKLGKFTIILDGFDEMKHSLSWEEFKYNFGQLNKLIAGNSKVILLGRPNAFLNDDEHFFALRGLKKTALGNIRESEWPEYYELEIESLTVPQIELFLKKYFDYKISKSKNNIEVNKLIHARDNKAKKISDKKIREISSRPVQLKMISDLLPHTTTDIENLTTTLLYSEFIDLILAREYEKESRLNITKDERRKFSRLIAIFLWENSSDYSIKFEDIPNELFAQFIPKNSKEINKIQRDMISGCFLSRKLGDAIYFPHRSFQEFFVAEEIIYQITHNPQVDFKKLNGIISQEVSDFLVGLSGLKTLSALDNLIKDYHGLLSLKLLNIYLKPENKDFILQKIGSSYSPWYYLIFVIVNNNFPYSKKEVAEFSKTLLEYIDANNDIIVQKLCFALILSYHEKMEVGEIFLVKFCEVYMDQIQDLKKGRSNKNKKYNPVKYPPHLKAIADFFLKVNLSKRSQSIDLRGLSSFLLKNIENWCFVTEWIKDGSFDLNEFALSLMIKNADPEVITLIAMAKAEVESLNS
jgi:hypothetical protein